MDICKASTKDLIRELVQREGIQKVRVGLYQPYDLVPKYGAPPIVSDTAVYLIVSDLNELLDIPDAAIKKVVGG